jgi:cobalt-zinc-cadmium efflux system outer membrane protein
VTVSQTFEFPGRLALRKAIANRQIELAQLGLQQFRAALGMRVRMLSFKLLAAQERADAARAVSERFQSLLAVLVQRDPAGVAPLLATRILEASGLAVNRRTAEAEKELFNARLELNQLRGLPVDTPVAVRRTPFLLPAAASLEQLIKSARIHNFEVRSRAMEMEQQGFRILLSENERWPAVTLQPYVAGQRGSERQKEFGLSVSLPLPLVNRNQGNIAATQARQRQAEAAMNVAVREMERQVAVAANSYRIQLETMAKWPENAAARFAEAAQLADQHYRLGAVPISTYVELQTQYLDAVDAMLATQLDAMEARQQVELLAGVTMEGTAIACRETPITVRLAPSSLPAAGKHR